MEASDIELTISAEDIYGFVREVKNLKAVNVELRKDIDAKEKAQDALRAEYADYKAKESERETSIRKSVFEECHRRTKLLELNERKNNAYQEYHNKFGAALNSILKILEKRITKSDELKIKSEKEKIDKAWQEFDKVQEEVNDLANEIFKQNPGF